MTTKQFYIDPYAQTCSATVTACTAMEDGRWAVSLSETCFYPEGGGQPGDNGTLGGVRVLDTREKGGDIVHITDAPLTPQTAVTGSLDWPIRFSRMQHHSGEHIVSGLIHRLYGYDNVGFHMGRDAVTLDLSGELTPEMLANVQTRANEAVWANLPIAVEYPPAEALETLAYRSKKELSGAVRIVTVPQHDVCACCGLHVAHTGEIGMIAFVNAQRYKGGTRIWMLCGAEALAHFVQQNSAVSQISALLSAKPEAVVTAVTRLLDERDRQKAEIAVLEERLFCTLAEQVPAGAFTAQWTAEQSPTALRRYVLALSERCTVAAVFSQKGTLWEYAIASSSQDVRPMGKALNDAFAGRGGGKSGLVQGSLTGERDAIEAKLAQLLA